MAQDIEIASLPPDVREKLAELELELSEGETNADVLGLTKVTEFSRRLTPPARKRSVFLYIPTKFRSLYC